MGTGKVRRKRWEKRRVFLERKEQIIWKWLRHATSKPQCPHLNLAAAAAHGLGGVG